MTQTTAIHLENGRWDAIDARILAELAIEGRLSIAELARRVGLSKSPCQARMKRLVDAGVIQGFRAVLNPVALRREHVAFVEVKLNDTREAALNAFNAAVVEVPEIEQCHMIAGAFDYLVKVRTRDIAEFRRVLGEKITALPHVASTSTFIAMQAVKEDFVC